jgi:hypothetical protein
MNGPFIVILNGSGVQFYPRGYALCNVKIADEFTSEQDAKNAIAESGKYLERQKTRIVPKDLEVL